MGKFILLFIMVLTTGIAAQGLNDTEKQINIAADLAKSGLQEKAKTTLIPLLHDGIDTLLDSRIRFLLGAICFEEQNLKCWAYHWRIIIEEYPNSEEATIAKEVDAIWSFTDQALIESGIKDLEFRQALDISRKFWTYRPPDWKMRWDDVKDIELALQYIDILLERYDDPEKRAVLFYDKFLIMFGCNEANYGLNHIELPPSKYHNEYEQRIRYYRQLRDSCVSLSDSLLELSSLNIYYVKTQFLLGILNSGTKFLSSKIKLKAEATIYFKNILAATEGEITNPYRLFASIWLGEYYKKDKTFIDGDNDK